MVLHSSTTMVFTWRHLCATLDTMELEPHVEKLSHEFARTAEALGPEARALAERLGAWLRSAFRLSLLDVLSIAAEEMTRELAPGSVDVRLRRGEPEFVVSAPGEQMPGEDASTNGDSLPLVGDKDVGIARINLRLPEPLKTRVEQASSREGLSTNAWLVRTIAEGIDQLTRSERTGPRTAGRGQRFVGWVR